MIVQTKLDFGQSNLSERKEHSSRLNSFFKLEKASARASSDRFSLSTLKSLIKSNYPKSTPTHSESSNHTSPKNSNRIPKEFPKNSQRILKKFPNQNPQPYITKEFPENL